MIGTLHPAQVRQAPDSKAFLEAEALLRYGNYAAGWPLYIETHSALHYLTPLLPEWQGPHDAIQKARIVVIGEGGYGDNIYFLRWLHTLRKWGADLCYLCPPTLAPLARRQGFRAVENWQGNVDIVWRQFDYFTSLIALPGKLGVTLDNYRWRGPYIKAGSRPWWPTKRVGLCWRAGGTDGRSLSQAVASQVVEYLPPTHRWVNLTYGTTDSEMENPAIHSWLDTAKALTKLDLVISVDTGVAHLAGAMGVECWTILPKEQAWHYPVGYNWHPLYPSMRMFRSVTDVLGELEFL